TAASYSKINLTWTDNSDNETGFEIWRSSVSRTTGFAPVGQTGANTTSYADSFSLSPSTTYYYQIRATGQYGQSAFVPTGTDAQAQWRFNNNYTDSSGNGKTLSASGSPTFDASDKKEGTHAVTLNGTSQYIDINTSSGDYIRGSYSVKSVGFWM